MAGLMTTTRRADATVVRAVSVEELVRRSHSVLVATPLQRVAEWANIGGARRIVTLTRVRVEEAVAGANEDSELIVRTLGGRIGDIGQLVDGEAELRVGEQSLLFSHRFEAGLFGVTAMAQGHYPFDTKGGGEPRLRHSPRVATLVRGQNAAVEKLTGMKLGDAKSLVGKVRPR
jgi:hypothetical protein